MCLQFAHIYLPALIKFICSVNRNSLCHCRILLFSTPTWTQIYLRLSHFHPFQNILNQSYRQTCPFCFCFFYEVHFLRASFEIGNISIPNWNRHLAVQVIITNYLQQLDLNDLDLQVRKVFLLMEILFSKLESLSLFPERRVFNRISYGI